MYNQAQVHWEKAQINDNEGKVILVGVDIFSCHR